MNLILSLKKALTLWPDRTALVDGDAQFTYREFGKRVARLADFLTSSGLKKQDVVAIISPNVHEFMEIYYACIVTGIILAPINFRLAAREISAILQDCKTTMLFAHDNFRESVDEAMKTCAHVNRIVWIKGQTHDSGTGYQSSEYEQLLQRNVNDLPEVHVTSDDIAHLYYTSGTTGKPKGVMLTHGNVAVHALTAIAELQLTDADTWAHIAPMFHLADAWATFAITWVGGRHAFLPYFRANDALQTLHNQKVTITNLIPTMINAMVNDSNVKTYDYSNLRYLLSGGAPIAPETVNKIISTFGCDYVQTYGMTETSPYLTLSLLKEHLRNLPVSEQLKFKSRTGRPFAAVELKVVREDGHEIACDNCEVGEIIVRGPTVTPGYWKQPEITAQAIRDGWLHTGDLATIDSEGYVNIVDRKKDMIITGGENVYSTEVEYVLYEHPSVLECAVIGVPDAEWGELVKAVVVLKTNSQASDKELIQFVRQRLAHYKAPKIIEFTKELPKTGSGKICKKDLKASALPT